MMGIGVRPIVRSGVGKREVSFEGQERSRAWKIRGGKRLSGREEDTAGSWRKVGRNKREREET